MYSTNVLLKPSGVSQGFPTILSLFNAIEDGDTAILYGGTREVTPGMSELDYSASEAPLQLSGKSNVKLIGIGNPIIYGEGVGDFLWLKNCTNIYIEGIEFKGNKPNAWEMPNIFSMIYLANSVKNLEVNRCRFINFGDHGIADSGGKRTQNENVHVHHCHFENGGNVSANDGVAVAVNGKFYNVHDNYFLNTFRAVEIEGNYNPSASTFTTDHTTETLTVSSNPFVNGDVVKVSAATTLPTGLIAGLRYYVVNVDEDDFQLSLQAGGSAVAFSSNGSGTLSIVLDASISFVNVHHNTIVNNYSHAIMVLPSSAVSSLYTDYNINNNIIQGGGGNSSSFSAIYVSGGERITISGNKIYNYQGHGINVTPQTANGKDIYTFNNEVQFCLTRGFQFGTSGKTLINAKSANDVAIGNGNSGMLIDCAVAGSKDICVANFTAKNNSRGSGHTGAGIEVAAVATSGTLKINDCYLTDDQSSKTQNYGLWLKSGVTNAMTRNNHIVGNQTAEIQDDATTSNSDGNIVSFA